MKIPFYPLFCLILFSFLSCSNDNTNVNNTDSTAVKSVGIDTSFLADKNFAYFDLKETEIVGRNSVGDKGHYYVNSRREKEFVALSLEQKVKLVVPFIHETLGVNSNYVKRTMECYFIAKQKKIGDLQPIIVQIGGDDYGSLTLIILNRDLIPVSGYNLSGGMNSGPYQMGDSLVALPDNIYSILEKDKFITYRVVESFFNDSLKRPSNVDSVVYKSKIESNGKIATKKVDSIRYHKPFEPQGSLL